MKIAEKLALAVLADASAEVRAIVVETLDRTLLSRDKHPSSGCLRIRNARTGSVRHTIHRVLESHGRLPRGELIRKVSQMRSDDPIRLERPVDEALRTDHSGHIQRIGRGEYAYVA